MKLTDLEPTFLKVEGDGKAIRNIDDIALSDGVMFLCPKCFPIDRHNVMCMAPCVPQSEEMPGPGRWKLVGTGYIDLSLVAGSSSVLLRGGCNAHFFVENGTIRMCE